MPELKPEQLLLFAAFIIPGAVSLYVHSMLVPQREYRLQDRVLEAVSFSVLNFVMLLWPISFVTSRNVLQEPWAVSAAAIGAFVLAPMLWPFLVWWLRRWFENLGWIPVRELTAWDRFFVQLNRDRGNCFARVVLNDGSVVGGFFGERSYATVSPESGHLYLEQLYEVEPDGSLGASLHVGLGLLLRPADYRLVYVLRT